jgi:adenylate cyclase
MDALLRVLQGGKRRFLYRALVGAGIAGLAVAVWLSVRPREQSPPAPAGVDSLAVLPFVERGSDAGHAFLGDGITEALIERIGRLASLKVIARASVSRYKGRTVDPQSAGRELGVRAILLGSVTARGKDLLVRAELVDTGDGRHLWGVHRNRKIGDLLTVQEEIANEFAQRLRIRLTEDERERLARPHTRNVEAYRMYLRGRPALSIVNASRSSPFFLSRRQPRTRHR